jgi:hypothetical protein
MHLSPSSEKQVVSSLRTLGFLSSENVADFRLRRVATRGDFTPVIEALAERFPGLMDAVATDVGPDELRALLGAFDAPNSSVERFWRFVRGALTSVGRTPLPNVHLVRAPGTAGRVRAPTAPSNMPQAEDPAGRRLLEKEAEDYVNALDRFLHNGNLEAAEFVSKQLRTLRDELRTPFGIRPSGGDDHPVESR